MKTIIIRNYSNIRNEVPAGRLTASDFYGRSGVERLCLSGEALLLQKRPAVLGSNVLFLDVGITSGSGQHSVWRRSIPKILHGGDGHESVLLDERCSDHGNPRKFDSKKSECLDDALGDQIRLCHDMHCGHRVHECDGEVLGSVPLVWRWWQRRGLLGE